MTPAAPAWVGRLLGLPGAVSFREFAPAVRAAGALEAEVAALDTDALSRAAQGLDLPTGAALPRDATARFLAVVREAAQRSLGLRPFDEQLLACCALLSGHAVEMDTGEGKTLVGALAAAGHAVGHRQVHVLSVNDYLAERDAEWMRPFFDLLGITVGSVGQHSTPEARRAAYDGDVLYAAVSEIGFDLLRDRLVVDPAERVNPVFDVAIVDEADAVLIDEAMIPLVLAGTSTELADDFALPTRLVGELSEGRDYSVDGDGTTVSLSDAGLDRLEGQLGGINLYAGENIAILTRLNLALHARVLLRRDVDYLVTEQGIRLINTSRGRIAHSQRWPDGLQSAIEAKEGLAASLAGVILDTLTVQDLLLGYRTLSGMSGTVVAVAAELTEFYSLPVGRVQRHRANVRDDEPDRVLLDESEKRAALIADVITRHRAGQPVLVGTQSVAESETLGRLLRESGIEPRVLNAKNDADEAAIIARAGERGAVTISTQMSGRGTDIRLGGPTETDRAAVVAVGGLAVIATGRYPSRRLDAQLRGRAGRQGDPGLSVTFASLQDELVQTTVPDHMLATIDRAGAALPPARRQQIVTTAQTISEGIRQDRHRATWAYTRAIAAQRAAVLGHRENVLTGELATETMRTLVPTEIAALEAARGPAVSSAVRQLALYFLDETWQEHLARLQEIRDGIHLRALAGQKPVDEFHRIALREFHGFFEACYRQVADIVRPLTAEDVGRDLAELGLRRPSATWTYMVTDDPLGNPGDRLTRELGRLVRSRVYRIE